MRKVILTLLALFTIISTNGQTHEDALLFSENAVVGTARAAGMSNAFGALGADLSTLSNNPAGLGVYQSYDFSFSLNFTGVDMTSYFLGNKITNSSGNFYSFFWFSNSFKIELNFRLEKDKFRFCL